MRLSGFLVLFACFFSAFHAEALPSLIRVPRDDGFEKTSPLGRTVMCVEYNGKYVPGTFKNNSKFKPMEAGVKAINEKLKAAKQRNDTKGIAKYKRKLKTARSNLSDATAACHDGPDTNSPSSDAVSLAPMTRALTREDVHYLLEKAGFGFADSDEGLVAIAQASGIDGLIDEFMRIKDEPTGLLDRVEDRLDGQLGSSTTQTPQGQLSGLVDLWAHTKNAYAERFALFLLSVWTVSGDVIADETFRGAFWDYYARLRSYALADANLPDLGVEVTEDPLMLLYLNNDQNVKGNPNENYARELMELFTLGPTNFTSDPNYSELWDIPMAARALTGWQLSLNYATKKMVATYVSSRHEPGPHTMFPDTSYTFSAENDEELVRGIFAHHPFVQNYYAAEILKEYVTPNPPQELIEALGTVIKENNFKLRPVMSKLFRSLAFFHSNYRDSLPKNSVEFAIESIRTLKMTDAINFGEVARGITRMGMQINASPSVFWFNPLGWTSPSVILERANFLAQIFGDNTSLNAGGWSAGQLLPSGAASTSAVIDHVAGRLGLGTLSTDVTANVNYYMSNDRDYLGVITPKAYDNTNATEQRKKGMGAYYVLMANSGFQMK